MTASAIDHAKQIAARIPGPQRRGHRFVVAIAGPPAAGKSTVADALVKELGSRAGLLGMDAFHYDDTILSHRGHRSRKGAPHTFDVAGYQRMLRAVRNEHDVDITVPIFDRTLELSRGSASIIRADQDVVVTEGNYLLLDEAPWSELRSHFDLTVWLDVPLERIEQRIRERWLSHGLSTAEAKERAAENDLPNAVLVQERSVTAQLNLR